MTSIISFADKTPVVGCDVFIDPSCRIIGNVVLEDCCSVWPMSVLRADSGRIVVGPGAAVLDQVMIEAPTGNPVRVEAGALISHAAVLHGCVVREGALVGIGAIVLDGAVVGPGAVVGAGALIPPRMEVPPRCLVLGQPGKVVRELRTEELERTRAQVSEVREKAERYLAQGLGG